MRGVIWRNISSAGHTIRRPVLSGAGARRFGQVRGGAGGLWASHGSGQDCAAFPEAGYRQVGPAGAKAGALAANRGSHQRRQSRQRLESLGRLQSVTQAADGFNMTPAVGAQLYTQTAKMDIQGPRLDAGAITPNVQHQGVAGYDLSRAMGKLAEKPEFHAGQVDGLAIQEHRLGGELHLQPGILIPVSYTHL